MIKKLARKLAKKTSAKMKKASSATEKTTKKVKKTAVKAKGSSAKVKKTAKRKTTGKMTQGELNALIAEMAYDLFEQRGYNHGDDQSDWYEAEKIILKNNKA
ncbi:MAG: DUF2934 domain-containing protein [Candidatus Omnitrophota bacterium]